MNTEFWLEIWEKNKIGFHQQEINSHLKSYWQHLNATPNCRVLVPLCGKTSDMLWLCGQGHRVLGVEISPLAVRDFFTENSLNPEIVQQDNFYCWEADGLVILQGDFFNINSDQVQDIACVFDRASLVALPVELRQQYVQHLKSILPDNVKTLLVTFDYEQKEMNGPPFSVSENEIRDLYQDNHEIILLCKQDVLDEYPQLQTQGLKRLQEKIYLLKPRQRNAE
ncbi:thiopurine S-methyltransferase [Methylobacter sp. S3L5C]|uniref:thiopurine S-methyltransferase n=1 Tax=Methylobacter sp. S3L5C TaxID=2839024 RepID=UPI001FAD2D79|nr:thiopurine S-methyltransferase [Methylobacter sp. S3L5C]UOA10216.1 thiopurine S-methyltransferase [Methylobacter sp. S3L5C]